MIETIKLFDAETFIGTWVLCSVFLGITSGILFAGRCYVRDGELGSFPFFALVGAIVGFVSGLIVLVYAMYLPVAVPVTVVVVAYVLHLRAMRRRVLFMQKLKGEEND